MEHKKNELEDEYIDSEVLAILKLKLILTSMENAIQKIKNDSDFPLEIFQKIRYEKYINDPIKDDSENFLEFINQSFSYIISYVSIIELLKIYPQNSFRLNLGQKRGFDIISKCENIIAEVFTCTNYKNNNKLNYETTKLLNEKEKNATLIPYIFYYSKEGEKINMKKLNEISIFHIDLKKEIKKYLN